MVKSYIKKFLPDLIIIEGFWQNGKSSLKQILSEKYFYKLIKEPDHIIEKVNRNISSWYIKKHNKKLQHAKRLLKNKDRIIMDRSIISSMAFYYSLTGKLHHNFKFYMKSVVALKDYCILFLYGDRFFVINKANGVKDKKVRSLLKNSQSFYDNYLYFYNNILPCCLSDKVIFIKVNRGNYFINPKKILDKLYLDLVVLRKSKEICAAAVLYYKNKFLLIYDHNYKHYVLPQGHQEKGENLKETILREIYEETGYNNLRVRKKLFKYQYHFKKNNKIIYKEIHLFLIKIVSLSRGNKNLNENEKYSNHFFTIKEAIKKVRWPQDKKAIIQAKSYIKI